MSEDFYDVLGVSQDALKDEIENTYRKKAMKYRPGVSNEDDAGEKFKEAQKAKEVPTDDEKRRMYDQVGREHLQQSQGRGGGGGGCGQDNPFGGSDGLFGGMDDGGDDSGNIFNNPFNGDAGSQQRDRPQQNRDVA